MDRIINDFSIQVATVNGSGSQTANLVILRSIFQMGIPVSGKNMFPSNIAGLPTWYTVRANKDGYIARKKEVDFLVAMNAETAKEDVLTLEPGRAVVYDEPLKLNDAAQRPHLLPGAVRQDRRRRLYRRQAAPSRQEHDLSRGALAAARHRHGRDGEGDAQAVRQEGQGGGPEHRRAEGRRRIRAAEPAQAGPVLGRAHAQDRRPDPDRGEHRRRARRDVRRRHRRRLVSDHPLVVAARSADRVHEEAPHRQGDRARRPTRSSRRRTRSRRSAWCSAPAGPARAR